ncbi:HAD family hydrolase [Orbaceae bacterium ESL0721]|nr:HAD family hydrolase [Orbaceae bacterium ESL0721]
MIKLIITDLDGTFLNRAGDYDRQYFSELWKKISALGVKFSVCTGKQCERVEELFGEYSSDIWIIGDSGTRIKYKGEFIYQSLIKNSLGRSIINRLKQVSSMHLIIACTPDGAVIESKSPQHLKDIARRSYARIIEVDDLNLVTNDFVKITVYDEQGNCPETRLHLNPFNDDLYIVVSEASWIDIADFGVHKGSTVQKLQEIVAATPEQTAAFGDGYNDLELLGQAEYSFAMRNAFDEVKEAAHFVIGSNDDNSVMKTINRLLALQS